MRYVYLLRSRSHPKQTYVGSTADLDGRLQAHNEGKSPHTAKHCPWRLVVAVAFSNEEKALRFEHYLKSGSGRAFALRHFW
ncbi:MAG: GIY-YIG nuclease family protein [Candidatus Brocadiae bacterium]|nr:GIY-YIG nuclease family protein [Candidatus Brocadiia bacterium]